MRYTTLHFGPVGLPGNVIVRIGFQEIPKIDVISVILHHKQSGSQTLLFCSPCYAQHVFPLRFTEVGMEYHLHVRGLVQMTTQYGVLYEVVAACSESFKVDPFQWNTKTDMNLEGFNDDLHDKDETQCSLKIGMIHNQSQIRIAYIVHSYDTFPVNRHFFIYLKYNGSLYLFTHQGRSLEYALPLDVKPASHLGIQVVVGDLVQEIGGVSRIYQITQNSGTFQFRTYTTKTELYTLLSKALSFLAGRSKKLRKMWPIEYLYRNKPEAYWKEIEKEHGSMMRPYRKDFNGDPYSVINGNMDGLFFSAVLDHASKQPPKFSYYGPIRLNITARALFQQHFHLYFADFYCHYQVHYVTLVMTPPHSTYDLFCNERLPLLDNTNNPFLCLIKDDKGVMTVKVTLGVHVEILFTEAVNLLTILHTGQGFFSEAEVRGRGFAKPEGIPKNKNCAICNL